MILFIVGPPGVGKTTLVRTLLGMQEGELPMGGFLVPKPKWTVTEHVCAAGHYTGGTFDGADTVPYNGVKDAVAYWSKNLMTSPVTILDGDRFSHAKAVQMFRDVAAPDEDFGVVYMVADEDVLTKRREARGSKQDPTWMKGRATKARRFYEEFGGHRLVLAGCDRTPLPVLKQLVERFTSEPA